MYRIISTTLHKLDSLLIDGSQIVFSKLEKIGNTSPFPIIQINKLKNNDCLYSEGTYVSLTEKVCSPHQYLTVSILILLKI